MKVDIRTLRPVPATLLAVLMVVGVAAPAGAAPRRAEQWYLDSLRIEEVHRQSTGRGVVVAVVDTGVDPRHPDLAGQVLPGFGTAGVSGDSRDEDGHGTHLAGIIAARKAGPDGVLGIAPGAKILPVKATGDSAKVTDSAGAMAIRMAADRGAKVINLAYGGVGTASPDVVEAIRYALGRDAVVVASAGNTALGEREVISPANVPGVIAVTGTNRRGSFWSGSVQGPEAVVAAPGERILNADIPLSGSTPYSYGNGTSDSAAIVSGVAALIRAKYPELDAPNVINRIIRTARDAGAPGRDPQYGFGVVNPLAALTQGVPSVGANPLLGPGAAAEPSVEAAEEGEFDVTQYGDRGGLTDQQVMIIGIGIAVLLVLLLATVVWLVLRRRARRRARGTPAGPYPPGMAPGQGPPPVHRADQAVPPVPAGHGPPAPGGYGVAPGTPGGYAPPGQPGPGQPPGYGPPGGSSS
ncbi:type VII secretion-associated serine protease mycosin [Micromonospora psammae]|uniref:type VII secretion-associated serine protease mycosin n=1 Tax=Micromonospora sp. CPCC 205556 TaxID=3122398 RepID=UPI002FEF73BD